MKKKKEKKNHKAFYTLNVSIPRAAILITKQSVTIFYRESFSFYLRLSFREGTQSAVTFWPIPCI